MDEPAEIEQSLILAPLDKDGLIKAKVQQILGNDFVFISRLGGGEGGQVVLCQYKGEDQKIRRLCNVGNLIAVKFPAEGMNLKNECLIAQFLNTRHTGHEIADLNIGFPTNDQYAALLLQYVPYKYSTNPPQSASIVSYLQYFYGEVVVTNSSRNPPNDPIMKAFCNDIGIIFAQFINEMQRCQFKLHNLRFLHLDTAARNFLLQAPQVDSTSNFLKFPLVLCDYGHTAQMDGNGAVNVSQVQRKPSTSRDFQAVKHNIATTQTDLFSLKCSCIGMVAVAIAEMEHDYNVLDIGQDKILYFKQQRCDLSLFRNDSHILAAYLCNLCEYLAKCPDNNIKDQTRLFIKIYSNYICKMPDSNMDMNAAHKFDENLLLISNTEYFKALVRSHVNALHRVDEDSSFESFLLTIKRLLTLPVTDEFRSSELFSKCQNLTDLVKAKQFAKEHYDPMQVLNAVPLDIRFPIVNEPLQLYWIIFVNKVRKSWLENLPEDIDTEEIKANIDEKVERLINLIDQNQCPSLRDVKYTLNKIEVDTNRRIQQLQSLNEESSNDAEDAPQQTPNPPVGYDPKPS